MNNAQRAILAIYLPLTSLILILDNIYQDVSLVRVLKLAIIASLFLAATCIKDSCLTTNPLKRAFFFVMLGEVLFTLGYIICGLYSATAALGAFSFLLAYLWLIKVFGEGASTNMKPLLTLLVSISFLLFLLLKLFTTMQGPAFYGSFFFSVILFLMVFYALSAPFRRFYSFRISFFMALAGCFILISDTGVAAAALLPAFNRQYISWLENIIWATYIPAWVLITVIIADDTPLRQNNCKIS